MLRDQKTIKYQIYTNQMKRKRAEFSKKSWPVYSTNRYDFYSSIIKAFILFVLFYLACFPDAFLLGTAVKSYCRIVSSNHYGLSCQEGFWTIRTTSHWIFFFFFAPFCLNSREYLTGFAGRSAVTWRRKLTY